MRDPSNGLQGLDLLLEINKVDPAKVANGAPVRPSCAASRANVTAIKGADSPRAKTVATNLADISSLAERNGAAIVNRLKSPDINSVVAGANGERPVVETLRPAPPISPEPQ